MIKVILIDDEPLARSIIKEYLQPYKEIMILEECNDGFEGLKAIQEHQPDLIFLDIQMPKINGFEMLELVEKPPAVIFTTAYDEYAIRAFETSAVDYLLKPFSRERFNKAMQKWLPGQPVATTSLPENTAPMPEQTERIVVKTGSKIKIIPISEVYYLEAADDYVKVHTAEGGFLKNKTMAYFEKTLDIKHFVRSHRSYIINVQEVTRIEPYEKDNYIALLKSGAQVPVSRTGYTRLREVLGL
jgi:two-component system, LytTR family, response regulator